MGILGAGETKIERTNNKGNILIIVSANCQFATSSPLAAQNPPALHAEKISYIYIYISTNIFDIIYIYIYIYKN